MKSTVEASIEKYNWLGCLFDLTPIFLAIVAYAITTQIFGNIAGRAQTTEIQNHLIYTLSIAIGAAALGLIIALGLTMLIASMKSLRESDQRFLFFTLLPLIPLLAQLSILWFGFDISGGLALATVAVVCAVIPILLPLLSNPSQRRSAIIDAIYVSCVCGLGLQILREAVGSNRGIGYIATTAVTMLDIDSFFSVLFMIAIFTSVLALLRRAAQIIALQRLVV